MRAYREAVKYLSHTHTHSLPTDALLDYAYTDLTAHKKRAAWCMCVCLSVNLNYSRSLCVANE